MNNDYLQHHGVKGQKWGVRRFQNKDGSWKGGHTSTERMKAAGHKVAAKVYSINENYYSKRKGANAANMARMNKAAKERHQKLAEDASSKSKRTAEEQAAHDAKKATAKKIAKGTAIAAATVGAAYGTYKVSQLVKNKEMSKASDKAMAYVDRNKQSLVGISTFKDGTADWTLGNKNIRYTPTSWEGATIKDLERTKKRIGDYNKMIENDANHIYNNTLSKSAKYRVADSITKAGDKVGSSVSKASNKVGSSVKKNTNKVLDTVKPQYAKVEASNVRTYRTTGKRPDVSHLAGNQRNPVLTNGIKRNQINVQSYKKVKVARGSMAPEKVDLNRMSKEQMKSTLKKVNGTRVKRTR